MTLKLEPKGLHVSTSLPLAAHLTQRQTRGKGEEGSWEELEEGLVRTTSRHQEWVGQPAGASWTPGPSSGEPMAKSKPRD